jgi:tungstate transport system ATP-binding protein
MLFQIRNLIKVYGSRKVLDIPELDFEKEAIYGLLGPNGSGKTTLLEILSLLLPPTTGAITYKDTSIDFKANNLTALRREIVMVQQNPVLFTTTVYKNLAFGLKIRGIPKLERKKIIEESLDLVGMGDFLQAEAHKLSGGETQRVAIARALTCSPKVMFFDEPTSNVDVENQIAIERILNEINTQKKISVIFTTHNLTQASRLSRQVISLFEGRKVHSMYENIFKGKITGEENGEKICLIQDQVRISLKTEKEGNVRLAIDPLEIRILTEPDPSVTKNIFKGKVVQLTDEGEQIRIVAEIGIPLNILLPKTLFRESSVHIGEHVDIYCPFEAVQIF